MNSPSDGSRRNNAKHKAGEYARYTYDWFWNLPPLEKFTLAYVIFTGIYAVITFNLYYVSKQSADAAISQAKLANEAMRVSERPYIEIGRPGGQPIAEWVFTKGKKGGIKVWFTNVGNTPAYRLYVNGGRDSRDFVHLSLKPVPPKLVGRSLEVRPGEEVGVDKINGVWSWVPGVTLAAHSSAPVDVRGSELGGQIDAAAKSGAMRIVGSFEYMNVFREYCCEPFVLTWDRTNQFTSSPALGPRDVFCAPDIPNICALKGEPSLAPQLLKSQK